MDNGWRAIIGSVYLTMVGDSFHLFGWDDCQEWEIRGPMTDKEGIDALRIMQAAPTPYAPWRTIDQINKIIDDALAAKKA
jgi:hypothetical protein